MAVYTHIPAETMATLVAQFDAGALKSVKGIAEGVSNSNYLVETDKGRYIFTVYEERVAADDLPFFFAVIDHLVAKGCPVPPSLKTTGGDSVSKSGGKYMAMMRYMSGLSVSNPNPSQAHSVGAALGQMHAALADFTMERPNALGPQGWFDLAARCGDDLDQIQPGLKALVRDECDFLRANWPTALPKGVIHADLFPDNVLMSGDSVSALIDFYFACTEIRAWDLAVTQLAWAFSLDGNTYNPEVGDGLIAGYQTTQALTEAEKAAFPILARGACLRFLLTRAWDWLNTPTGALVTRKDPLALLGPLKHYSSL